MKNIKIEKVSAIDAKREELLRLGKEGRSTLQEVADVWGIEKDIVAEHLYSLHALYKYAYLVDGKGYFRIFQEIQ